MAEIERASKKPKLEQRVFNLYGKTRKIPCTVGVTLQKKCTNRCRLRRCCSTDCRTHRWRHISVHSTKFLSRERGFFFIFRWLRETLCKEKNKMILEERGRNAFGLISPGRPCAKPSQQQSDYTQITRPACVAWRACTSTSSSLQWIVPSSSTVTVSSCLLRAYNTNLGVATNHPSFSTSCSFMNQVLAQLDLLSNDLLRNWRKINPYKNDVYLGGVHRAEERTGILHRGDG